MRPFVVARLPRLLDHGFRFARVSKRFPKLFPIQAFVAQLTVKALHKSIAPMVAGFDLGGVKMLVSRLTHHRFVGGNLATCLASSHAARSDKSSPGASGLAGNEIALVSGASLPSALACLCSVMIFFCRASPNPCSFSSHALEIVMSPDFVSHRKSICSILLCFRQTP